MKNNMVQSINKISKSYVLALKDLGMKIDEKLTENFMSIFENVLNRYSEPHRYFHNIEHVAYVLDNLKISNPEVVLAAIYHDVVYVPGAVQNEYCSAQLAAKHLSILGVKTQVIFTVSKHILSTENHIPINIEGNKALLDADMSILAAAPRIFNRYCSDLRKEFPHLNSADFGSQRSRWALEQLGRKNIFHCKSEGAKILEVNARINLRTLTKI